MRAIPRRLAVERERAGGVIVDPDPGVIDRLDKLEIVDPGVRVKFGVKIPEGVFLPLNQDVFGLKFDPGMFPMLILLGMVGAPPVAKEDANGGIGGGGV